MIDCLFAQEPTRSPPAARARRDRDQNAWRGPNSVPQVFGYHELFHVLTLGAAGCQYAAIGFFVLPRA